VKKQRERETMEKQEEEGDLIWKPFTDKEQKQHLDEQTEGSHDEDDDDGNF